jgi:hypothetical protein
MAVQNGSTIYHAAKFFSVKTSVIAASAIVALLVLGAATVTFAHSGFGLGGGSNSNQNTNSNTNHGNGDGQGDDNKTGNQDNQGNDNGTDHGDGGHFNLTVGQSFTFSNLSGHWVAFSNSGNHSGEDQGDGFDGVKVGNSTGAFTFKVTSVSGEGANLTITSGKFTINGTTYTVSTGKVTLNAGEESGFGSGTASGGATFEIHVGGIHGNLSSSALVGAIKLDVKVGTSDYLVILGSGEGVGEDVVED